MISDHYFGGASHDPVGKAIDTRGGAMSQAFCRSSARAPGGPKFFYGAVIAWGKAAGGMVHGVIEYSDSI